MFHAPNQHRNRTHRKLGTPDTVGDNGVFEIPIGQGRLMMCIVSDGLEAPQPDQWEHVSVRMIDMTTGQDRTPTWEEMAQAKSIFWDSDDCVVQFHPPKVNYVNTHPHVLHLWRAVNWRMPQPPKWMV